MQSVEKEGTKVCDKLSEITLPEGAKLQANLEDFGNHGTCISAQSLRALTLGH